MPLLSPPILCPILVGRTMALGDVERVIEALFTGTATPHTLVFSGEAGIGESPLVTEAEARPGRGGHEQADRWLPHHIYR